MKQMLGSGAVGAVHLCLNQDNNQLYAMKVIQRSKFKTWGQSATTGLPVNEMEVLKSLNHKNVVKLHEIIDDP